MIRASVECLGLIARHGVPQSVVSVGCGVGDELMATCAVHELRKRGSGTLWFMSEYPTLHIRNPSIDRVVPWRPKLRAILTRLGAHHVYPMYHPASSTASFLPDEPSMLQMLRTSGVRGNALLQPYMYLSAEERRDGRAVSEPYIVVQSSARAARYSIETKDWHFDRMQTLVDQVGRTHVIVQLGAASDPLLTGAIDLRGKTNLRQAAAVLSNARLFIGLEGFLMHAARAVNIRSVVIIGGRTYPYHFSYPCNEALFTELPCSGCMLKDGCPHRLACMDEITVERAIRVFERAIDQWDAPLETYELVVTDERSSPETFEKCIVRRPHARELVA